MFISLYISFILFSLCFFYYQYNFLIPCPNRCLHLSEKNGDVLGVNSFQKFRADSFVEDVPCPHLLSEFSQLSLWSGMLSYQMTLCSSCISSFPPSSNAMIVFKKAKSRTQICLCCSFTNFGSRDLCVECIDMSI